LKAAAYGNYDKGDVVLEQCYSNDIASVQVKNPTNNAWVGAIEYSSDGGDTYQPMSCTGCKLCERTNQIVVDGNSDSGGLAKAKCLGGVACSVTQARYALRIQTGTAEHNDGTLIVHVDSGSGSGLEPVSSGTGLNYKKGSVVLQQCYINDIASVQVTNPSINAWTGAVEHSSDGGETYQPMACTGCVSVADTSQIVVDGNDDGASQANTQCLGGVGCSIVQATCAVYSCPTGYVVKNSASTTYTESNCCQAPPTTTTPAPTPAPTTTIPQGACGTYTCQQGYYPKPGSKFWTPATQDNCCEATP
jgi:hypothetical protein